ncbi:MAG: hypothetical protein JWM09_929 [Francisellaceae bacterium]|nr:hypothetical protein [Francisellaceae bacterium]
MVGGANTLFTLSIFTSLIEFFNLNPLYAISISTTLGIIFSYLLNFLWAFKLQEKLQFKKRFLQYFIIYLSSFGFNLISLSWLLKVTSFSPLILQLIITPFIVLINYSGLKLWALAKS